MNLRNRIKQVVHIIRFDAANKCGASSKLAAKAAQYLLLVGLLSVVAGCKKSSTTGENTSLPGSTSPSQGTIVATPNPVPVAGRMGTTTLTWDSGGIGPAQIYVVLASQPEKLVSSARKGTQEINWIQKGKSYEFRMYAGKDKSRLLNSVTVTTTTP
jgi:hypothetical protein